MKGCLPMLGVLGVLVAAAAAVVVLFIVPDFDETEATEPVTGTIVRSYEFGGRPENNFNVFYRYEVDGQEFRGRSPLYSTDGFPVDLGADIPLCVIPDEPAQHLVLAPGHACGDADAGPREEAKRVED